MKALDVAEINEVIYVYNNISISVAKIYDKTEFLVTALLQYIVINCAFFFIVLNLFIVKMYIVEI